MRALVACVCAVALSACFNFDKAYQDFCDGGRCDVDSGSSDSGATSTGGGSQNGGGVQSGGGAQNGGGAASGGGSAGGGSAGGGSATGGGSGGCLGWGETCSGFGQCCSVSDGGIRMDCGVTNRCLEYAPDCRERGFSCTTGSQCCTNRCDNGRCSAPGEQVAGGRCRDGAECAPANTCVNSPPDNVCTSSYGTEGDFCNTSDGCASGTWCDLGDAGPHAGTCRSVVDAGCGGLASPDTSNCCSGLVAGNVSAGEPANCCQPTGSWCWDSASPITCCSGRCLAGRCAPAGTTTVALGERCGAPSDCQGSTTCDFTGSVCVNRLWLPAGACSIRNASGACRFDDGGICFAYGRHADAGECCSGRTDGEFCYWPRP